MRIAPISIAAVAYPDATVAPPIMEAAFALREAGAIRVLDLMGVKKTFDGQVVAMKTSDLSDEEDREYGALIGALVCRPVGLVCSKQMYHLSDAEVFC